ncbi:MAG: FKBP-type peptidyl-prolyl cis-trans isomerase [Terracidiphilus sp.]|nr:FKBP-type peptidyl-prolyl cis-trans isomerase [Terracidiphilus sp.]
MKYKFLILLLAASAAVASAQTTAKPTTGATKPASTATKSAASAAKPTVSSVKVPPGLPPVKGIRKTLFSLQYQDIKIGTGADAEPNKLYKVHYTGWLADGGRKFDSSYDHRQPVLDKDGKPVLGADGKPTLGDPQPFSFPQGFGRLIPGWDQGFADMKVGGKRRLLIPWQLAYGAKGRPGPDAAHPGIPAKADLIFDVELLDVTDLPMAPNHPGMPGMSGGHPMPGGMTPRPGTTVQANHPPAAPTTPAAPASPATPAAPAASSAPASVPAPAAPATTAQPK